MKCQTEQRQITRVQVTTGGTMANIFKNPGSAIIIEIAIQTEANADLQIFEGGNTIAGNSASPYTALTTVEQYLLWSTPGKINPTTSDLNLQIVQANVFCRCMVRFLLQ